MTLNVGREALAGCPADARADLLDDGHERIREQQRPRNCEAELCACLGIGGDAAWIIVCGPGDKTWPERAKNTAAFQTRRETVRSLRDHCHLADRQVE
jgi:hypothetical protein